MRRGSASSQRLLGEFEWIAAVTMLAWGSVAHFADRNAVLYLGRIVEEGPAKDVVRTHSIPTRRRCSQLFRHVTRGRECRRKS